MKVTYYNIIKKLFKIMDKEGCLTSLEEKHVPIGGDYPSRVKVGILPTGLHYDSAAMVFTHL